MTKDEEVELESQTVKKKEPGENNTTRPQILTLEIWLTPDPDAHGSDTCPLRGGLTMCASVHALVGTPVSLATLCSAAVALPLTILRGPPSS